jgi:hypothetical protein
MMDGCLVIKSKEVEAGGICRPIQKQEMPITFWLEYLM